MLEQTRDICLSSLPIIIPAILVGILIFRGAIIRRWHDAHFPQNLKFPDTELVITPDKPLRRTILFGSALFVPHGVNAVVSGASSNIPTLFKPGDYIVTDFFKTVLYYKYIDVTLRNLTIMVEDAPTKDGFNVSIWMKISFCVKDAEKVAGMNEPIWELIMLVENAVRSATLRYDHDALVPTPEILPVSNSELVNWIRDDLVARASEVSGEVANDIEIVKGIVIHSIVVHSRLKDPNRKEPSKEPSETDKAIEEIEKRKKIAEIENQIVLENAKATLEQKNILDPVLERELEWENRRTQPRLEIERERVRVQERTAALTPILQIFAHILSSPGSSRMVDSWSMNRLSRLLENIITNFWEDPDIVTAEYRTGPRPAENAREKLNYQLVDLWMVEGYVEHRVREYNDASLGLMILIHKKQAVFNYDVSGTNPLITRIILRSSKGRYCDVPKPGIYNNYTLPEAIERLNERYHPNRNKSGDENGCASWI